MSRHLPRYVGMGAGLALTALPALAAPFSPVSVAGIPAEFLLFGLTLLGVALFQKPFPGRGSLRADGGVPVQGLVH